MAIGAVKEVLAGFWLGLRVREPVRPVVSRAYRRNFHAFAGPWPFTRSLRERLGARGSDADVIDSQRHDRYAAYYEPARGVLSDGSRLPEAMSAAAEAPKLARRDASALSSSLVIAVSCCDAAYSRCGTSVDRRTACSSSTTRAPTAPRRWSSDEFPEAELLRLEENIGGAGGFHRGAERAHAHGYDWLWLMDDDTIATGDSLAALLAGAARAPGGIAADGHEPGALEGRATAPDELSGAPVALAPRTRRGSR